MRVFLLMFFPDSIDRSGKFATFTKNLVNCGFAELRREFEEFDEIISLNLSFE